MPLNFDLTMLSYGKKQGSITAIMLEPELKQKFFHLHKSTLPKTTQIMQVAKKNFIFG
jgi:hypothetical protein